MHLHTYTEMGVEPKIGENPPKWMVKIRVPNPMNKWDDLGGPQTHPYFLVGNTQISLQI